MRKLNPLTYWVDEEGVDTTTLLSDTLLSIGLTESVSVRTKVWVRKKPMNLCACESEEHDHEVGAGVNTTLLSGTL